MSETILLIDGDQFLFKACIAVEQEVKWDDQNHVLYSNEVEAWDVFQGLLDKTYKTLKSTTAYLAFSGKGNFRKDINPTYKDNRKNTRKPLCYASLLDKCYEEMKCLSVPLLEADDLMGIWSTGKFKGGIIVSDDKDMKTIPGRLYRDGEDGYDVFDISVADADYNWLFQTLTGDTTDGYSGCPDIGKVKAGKILNEFRAGLGFHTAEAWKAVVQTFEAAGLDEEEALLQARMARILRAEDWDSGKKEVKLWQPSK